MNFDKQYSVEDSDQQSLELVYSGIFASIPTLS